MKNILVSILIPCYNGEKWLNRSILSAINQTYKNIEIIIANDGSTDSSAKIIAEFAKQDKRIRILTTTNHGLGWQRNNLINATNGDYFCFLDVDDILPNDAIENLVKPIYKNNIKYDLIAGKIWWQGESEKGNKTWSMPFFINTSFHGVKDDNVDFFIRNCATLCHALLFNKKWYKSLNIDFPAVKLFEDTSVVPYIILNAKSFKAVNKRCYNYVRRSNSLSSFRTFSYKQIEAILWAVHHIMELFYKSGMINNKKYAKAIKAWFCRVGYLINQFELNAINSDIDQQQRQFIFMRYKYEFLYLIFIKYKLSIYYFGSWWQIATFFFIRHGFKKELKYIKEICLLNNEK